MYGKRASQLLFPPGVLAHLALAPLPAPPSYPLQVLAPESLPLSPFPPSFPLQVVDYWVFERPVFKGWVLPKTGPRGAEWKLVARLKQPEGRPPPLTPVPV